MRVIPAIDIIDGKCVRLSKGDFSTQKIYNEDPLEVAKAFEGHGIQYLHLVDLDGAKSKHIVNHKVLELISTKTNLKIDFGGGLKIDEDLRVAFDSGAEQITGGSIAVKEPEVFKKWLITYGPEKIIFTFLDQYKSQGVKYIICTDISKDGMLQGPSFNLYKKILKETKVKLIASGGISQFEELHILSEMGCEGAIIGKAIYEKRITLTQLEQFILLNN